MGVDFNAAKALLFAQYSGVSFEKVATIGRQKLLINFKQFKKILKLFNIKLTDEKINEIFNEKDGFSEPFLRFLGAERICSIDYSEFEGATLIHDMNVPIHDDLKSAFSVVIDSGSLEHIFNFPIAIKNCMEMVEIGGHFITITPANNFMGHGFYQFSPELFFRIFTENNGFEIDKVIIFENFSNTKWYEVSDPAEVQERVNLRTVVPALIFVLSKKIKEVPILNISPMQSDYVSLWNQFGSKLPDKIDRSVCNHIGIKKFFQRLNSSIIYRIIRRSIEYPLRYNKKYFKKVNFNNIGRK